MVILDRNGKVVHGASTTDSVNRSARPRLTAPMLDTAAFNHDLAQQIHNEVERVLEPLSVMLESLDARPALPG